MEEKDKVFAELRDPFWFLAEGDFMFALPSSSLLTFEVATGGG